MTTMTTKFSPTIVRNIGFGLVLIVALALSGWSLFGLAALLGIPKWLAIVASVAYDGASIYLGNLAIEYARSQDASASTKFYAYLFIGLSVLFNGYHAALLGLGWFGVAFYAIPSLTAGILFEQFLKFEHKTELRNSGRTPERLPLLPKIFWLLHPKRSFQKYDSIILQRLEKLEDFTEARTTQTSKELPPLRSCKKCGSSKLLSDFRQYSKSAVNYTSRTCKECEGK